MIEYFKDLLQGFKRATITKKSFIIAFLVIYLILILGTAIRVDYVVTTPGAFNHTAKTTDETKSYAAVTIETNNQAGYIYTIGVYSHIRVSLFQYLISKMSNRLGVDDYKPNVDLTSEEEYERGVILKDLSITNALIVAYEHAQLKNSEIVLEKNFEGIIVSAVLKYSKSGLMINDLITKINDVDILSYEHYLELRDAVNKDDYFKITVNRGDKERVINAQKVVARNRDNQVVVDQGGNMVYTLAIEANPSFKITNAFPKFKISEKMHSIGGSGGAMLTLAIYNALLEEDVTSGKIIAGTGTININGKVGDIGGVGQKIVTAYMYGIDIFFVNPEDYEEALEMYNLIKAPFKLYRVATFAEIIAYLEGEQNG